jgi:hypothetical protein
MGLHDPFEKLKHKLWPKEGSGVKLPIWFPTTKSQELLWFPCVQVACNIPLESSWQGLKLFFRPHLNQQRYGPSKLWKSQLWEFRESHLGVLGQIDIWLLVRWPGIEYTIWGKWQFPPSPSCGESCESVFAHGSSVHQSVSTPH